MTLYDIQAETSEGERIAETLAFRDDDAAITYVLPLARGRLVEVSREGKLVATVDERRCFCS